MRKMSRLQEKVQHFSLDPLCRQIETQNTRLDPYADRIGTALARLFCWVAKLIADCLNFAITFTGHMNFLIRITCDCKK